MNNTTANHHLTRNWIAVGNAYVYAHRNDVWLVKSDRGWTVWLQTESGMKRYLASAPTKIAAMSAIAERGGDFS